MRSKWSAVLPRELRRGKVLRMRPVIAVAGILFMSVSLSYGQSSIENDEEVLFLPSSAKWDAQKKDWVVEIRGWIYEPERDSTKRRALLQVLKNQMGLKKGSIEEKTFNQRAWRFLIDNEGGKNISVELGGKVVRLAESADNGHFSGETRLSNAEMNQLLDKKCFCLAYQAIMPKGDKRVFSGRVYASQTTGVSLISDIDDTIKISHVNDKKKMLRHALSQPFSAVPGLANVYQQLERKGVRFHYVSASPWHLYEPLRVDFFEKFDFPAGTFHMKMFRFTDRSFLNLLKTPKDFKVKAIRKIMRDYPGREFILVGDSTERDADIFNQIAREFPSQVAAIRIRYVVGSPRAEKEVRSVFRRLDPALWRVFEKASQIDLM